MMFPLELGKHPESSAEEDTNTARKEEASTNGKLAKDANKSNAETGKIDVRVEGTQEGVAEKPDQGDETPAASRGLDSTTATGEGYQVELLQQQQMEPLAASLDGDSLEKPRNEEWRSLLLELAEVKFVVEEKFAALTRKMTTFGRRF